MNELKSKAELIHNEINNIIGRIDPNDIPDAVNWGDLMCIEVGLILTDIPPSWTATIAEAAPDAMHLAAHVTEELSKHGFSDVIIRCEW